MQSLGRYMQLVFSELLCRKEGEPQVAKLQLWAIDIFLHTENDKLLQKCFKWLIICLLSKYPDFYVWLPCAGPAFFVSQGTDLKNRHSRNSTNLWSVWDTSGPDGSGGPNISSIALGGGGGARLEGPLPHALVRVVPLLK